MNTPLVYLAAKSRLFVVLLIILAVGILTWFLRSSGSREGDIRRVVLISIDTCRADHLSCYGYPRQTTPHIDAIANEGVLFTHAQSTNPITLPAHCSMLTGTNPLVHGIHLNHTRALDDSQVTLAEMMREEGYQTGAVIGAFPLHSRFGLDQGFDTYDEQFNLTHETLFFNERNGQEVSRAAMSWLTEHRDEPFFLFVHYFDPHFPYTPPEPFASEFSDSPYAGEIAHTDACIGLIIDKLKELELFDSTMLIITADHGESLGEHGEESHTFFIYQSTMRIPLIIKAPGCRAGQRIDAAVSLVDLVPTIRRMMGLSALSEVQGVDLSGYLTDRTDSAPDRWIYSETLFPAKFGCCPLRGLVHGKWRYIEAVTPELYDLSRDPVETNNLFEEEKEVATLLQSRLKEIISEQSRKTVGGNSSLPDQETVQRLQSLGYFGGPGVQASTEIGKNMEDPKDFIPIHRMFKIAQSYWGQNRLEDAKNQCLQILELRPRLLPILLMLAPIAVEQGRMTDAVGYYSDVLEIVEQAQDSQAFSYEAYRAHTNRGLAYRKLGMYQAAVDDCDQAIKLMPNLVDAYIGRGDAYQQLGQNDSALSDYDKAIELEPDDARTYNYRGNLYRQMGRSNLALRDSNKAIELKPDYPEAYNNRGTMHEKMGKHHLALRDYAKAVELKPDFAHAHFNRGAIYERLGKPELAFEDYAVAIELDAGFTVAYMNRGLLYSRRDKNDLAVADFTKVIELNPDSAPAFFHRGTIYQRLGEFQLAQHDLANAIELKPDFPEAIYRRGINSGQLGELQLAIRDFDRAIEMKSNFADAYFRRGIVHQQLYQAELAIRDYKQVVGLSPENGHAYNNLAWLLATCPDATCRDGEQALSSARKACELLGWDHFSALDTLAAANAESGHFDEAVKWQTKAITLAPESNKSDLLSRLELYQAREPFRDKAAP